MLTRTVIACYLSFEKNEIPTPVHIFWLNWIHLNWTDLDVSFIITADWDNACANYKYIECRDGIMPWYFLIKTWCHPLLGVKRPTKSEDQIMRKKAPERWWRWTLCCIWQRCSCCSCCWRTIPAVWVNRRRCRMRTTADESSAATGTTGGSLNRCLERPYCSAPAIDRRQERHSARHSTDNPPHSDCQWENT